MGGEMAVVTHIRVVFAINISNLSLEFIFSGYHVGELVLPSRNRVLVQLNVEGDVLLRARLRNPRNPVEI